MGHNGLLILQRLYRSVTDALVLSRLTKTFGGKAAVADLDLTVRSGELYALLGPNGAGKTTTLRMVAGLLAPTSGSISVFGIDALRDPAAAKAIIAWAPDEPMLYDRLNPMEYLEFVAGLWGVEGKTARAKAEEHEEADCDFRALPESLVAGRRRCLADTFGVGQKFHRGY